MTTKDALLTEGELWAAAGFYVAEHGVDAWTVAAEQHAILLGRKDLHGVRNYQEILDRITQLLNASNGRMN